MSTKDVIDCYRTRFQLESCYQYRQGRLQGTGNIVLFKKLVLFTARAA